MESLAARRATLWQMFTIFFSSLPRHLIDCFRGKNIFVYIVASALTFVAVESGFDWRYFLHTRGGEFQALTLPGAISGFFVPIIVPVAVFLYGEFFQKRYTRLHAVVLAQAAAAGWLISSFMKVFTGRTQPEFLTLTSYVDISHGFHFGFLQHGIFWGWPSSHAAVACALSTAAILVYRKNPAIVTIAFLYAAYITLAVSISIHWFSDALAGAMIGTSIGYAIARSFQREKHTTLSS